jgi:tellurite resistance protein
MGLEGQHTARHSALLRFAPQQREHGLVPAVHTIKVADGQCTRGCNARMVEAAKNLHG